MAELKVDISDELEKEVRELPEIKEMLREFMRLKVFELELKRSRELQRFVLEALASKSRLSKKNALELGSKINKGMLQELKERGLV